MRKKTETATFRGKAALLLSLLLAVSCNDGNDTPGPNEKPQETIELHELLGAWEAEGYHWDLDEGRSVCYRMTDDGQDFALNENGDYVVIPSIRDYCEQYAADYNADPANDIEGTPEDFADHPYEDTGLFTNIVITEEKAVVYSGQRIEGAGTIAILCVTGSYSYDKAAGQLTVADVAIESDPRTLAIDVSRDEEGRTNFRYSDFDMYTTPSYDRTKTYYVYAPMIYYCRPGEPYIPRE